MVAQTRNEIRQELEQHFEMANQYNDLALYGESIGQLDQAIEIARQFNLEETLIKANIRKAEIFRKTQNFERGINLLESQKRTEKYPRLHVQKLGRLAALYAENGRLDLKTQDDSVAAFTSEGIDLAVQYGFTQEEAGLRNELGFRQNRQRNFDMGLANLLKSAELFQSIGDKENETGALVNVLDLYVNKGDFDQFDSLYPILVSEVEGTDWHATRGKLYSIISKPFQAKDDTVLAAHWTSMANSQTVQQMQKTNSAQMAAFKIIHDTNLYKEDALRKSRDLEREHNKTKELYFFIVILTLVLVIVVLVFIRERRLKQTLNSTVDELNLLNDKYQMLMVESNHRIKNNLQMIISMLEYTKKGSKNMDPKFIQSISGKIRTISALHKHLYLDVHNGKVDLKTFFSEVINHYTEIGTSFAPVQNICAVQIKGERIVYFGLILNEMLANTLQHGNSANKELKIEVKAKNDGYIFTYSDQSVHPENAKKGTGISLIEDLVWRVNGTDYMLDPETGTFQFSFKSD
jgi:two-component sensor histidine kinase